jgi:hypothetical protein
MMSTTVIGHARSHINILTDGLELYNLNFSSSHIPSHSRHNVEPLPVFSPRPTRPVALAKKVESTLRRGQA